jgi:benzoyl-CoA reductase/2-hydroxyglutaryl-CoA dehydratase subunit BcrC/BadD/HgdB
MRTFDEFTRAYHERDRAALEWKAQGGQVVGCLGSDVPEEFLIAAGFLTVRVCGDPRVSAETADLYIERAFDPLVRSQFAQIVVGGAYSYLDHLIVSRSSDALVRVFYYLRELRRVEPSLPVPNLYFFDFLHSRYRTSALYNRDRARDLKRVVERWCGRPITPEALAAAIATCEENRRLLRQLAALRAPGVPRVSGVQALQVIGASMFLPREEHNRLLRAFLVEAEELSPLSGVRLFVTGSAQDHSHFYELLESCGAVVVGEDHDWGSRHSAGEIDLSANPTDAIVDRYHLRQPSASRASVSARVAALVEQVRAASAQGVIFYILEKDDAPSWDFPEQRKALEALGIPVLLLDRQPYQIADANGLQRQIDAFVGSIAASGATFREETIK